MITINKVEDVPVFLGCIALTEHLKDKVKQMLTTLETENLESYGSIYGKPPAVANGTPLQSQCHLGNIP